jgi:hypothetical protein
MNWDFDLALQADKERELWAKSERGEFDSGGVVYWKVFRIVVDKNRQSTISQNIPMASLKSMWLGVNEFEKFLNTLSADDILKLDDSAKNEATVASENSKQNEHQ